MAADNRCSIASLTACLLTVVAAAPAEGGKDDRLGSVKVAERSAPANMLARTAAGTTLVAAENAAGNSDRPAGERTGDGEILTRQEVLRSSAEHMPRILEAMAQFRAARGDVVSALGSFDLVLRSEGFARVSGSWSGRVLDTEVRQALRPYSAEVFSRYRISGGRFPIYENIFNTNRNGEIKVGFVLSLLRDRAIDERRANVRLSRLDRERAELELLLTRVAVQHQALSAYLGWTAAGQVRAIYRDLLVIAERRQDALRRRVSEGDAADILLTENRQNLFHRATLVAQAERDVNNSGLTLAQYYRNAEGRPETPEPKRAPDALPTVEDDSVQRVEAAVAQANIARPELDLIDRQLDKARIDLALGENDLLPKLTFGAEVDHDMGGVDFGGPTFDSTDTKLKVGFSIPLQRRFAEGRVSRAKAELQALRFRRQYTSEQIELEVRRLVNELRAAAATVDLASKEVEQARAMQAAERRRFEAGGSDFFILNQREESLADARIRQVEAQLSYHQALANYQAATADLQALGLE